MSELEQFKKAVFLDRDGTINVEKHYLIEPDEFEFVPGVPTALKRLQDAGFLLIVVTNQSGVARGYFDMAAVERLHSHMQQLLSQNGVRLSGIYCCPHHPTAGVGEYLTDCNCRKGKPGMLQQAARELEIDLQSSFMIGDKEADFLAGLAAGCTSYLVRTGYGEKWKASAKEHGVHIVSDLSAAVDLILG
jgi:D-glycero-D-manno-heptose 1,7-bisphosphate phosphatase